MSLFERKWLADVFLSKFRRMQGTIARLICTNSLVVSYASLVCLIGCTRVDQPAIVSVGSSDVNLGKVLIGESIAHVFELRNVSNHAVQIESINASCSCMLVESSDAEPIGATISPGCNCPIRVSMHARNIGDTQTGKVVVVYRVRREAIKRSIDLFLTAELESDYTISCDSWDLGEVSRLNGSKQQIEIALKSKTEKTIEIEQVGVHDGRIEILEQSQTGITLAFDAGLIGAASAIRIPIEIKTTSDVRPIFLFDVFGTQIPQVTTRPQFISVGSDRRGRVVEEVSIFTDQPSEVSIDCPRDKGIEVAPKTSTLAKEHVFSISIDESNEVLRGSISLSIKIENQDRVDLELPFCRFVRSPTSEEN